MASRFQFRHNVIRPIEKQRVDLAQLDKIHDLDRLGFLRHGRVQFGLPHNHEAILFDLIAFNRVLRMHLFSIGGAIRLLLQRHLILIVQGAEMQALLRTAVNNLTGIVTRPKLMAPVQMGRRRVFP